MKSYLLGSSAAAGLAISLVAGHAASQKAPMAPKPASATPAKTAGAAPAKAAASDLSFEKSVQPFLKTSCYPCHSGNRPQARLGLDKFTDENSIVENKEEWSKVLSHVNMRTMPPPGFPKPSEEAIGHFTGWVGNKLASLNQTECSEAVSPGRVTLRRLNRLEYKNTIRDLMGVDFTGVEDFPSDDVGYGFDNIGDVLSLPPMLMEKYLGAAEEIVAKGYPSVVKALPKDPAAREAYAREVLTKFTRRAFRRPVQPAEVDRLINLVKLSEKHKLGFDEGMKLALGATLVSPHFLYRIEQNRAVGGAKTYRLGNYELASRLSYFLWSSMPDETLFAKASAGKLRDSKELEAEVRRMLKDPKAKGLVENFGSQWLQTRRLKEFKPDPEEFPNFDEKLRAAMLAETDLFFEAVVKEDRSVLDFLDGDYTFVNERLAKHYGIPGIKGPNFRRVSLKGTNRGGVITQASILTLTSNPTRTSPVKRGKWIMEQLLNDAPPPPPPNVPELEETKAVSAALPLRKRLEQHREDPKCASCHSRMDPMGFALENFDGTGQWRTQDGKFKIDATDKLPDGRMINGASGLSKILKENKEQFAKALTERMMTFALGRGLENYDHCAVDAISDTLKKNDYKISSLMIAIVKSDPFQMRGVETPPAPGGKKS
ncbi:MAG: DUF1592 domain-containing protein [Armatimonadetes bacterium]|nr:DUF1592 domain-containing protein [Armatimonadota bacterium]